MASIIQQQGSRQAPQQGDEEEDDWEDLDFFEMICKLKHLEDEKERPEPLEGSKAQHIIQRAVFDSHRLVSSSILTRDYNTKHDHNLALAEFDLNEIVAGELLGSGGFARVHEVLGFHLLDDSGTNSASEKYSPQVQAARDFLVEYATRESTGEHRFALKHLKKSLAYKPDKFASAVVDLAVEAHILSVLDHPNILKIRGVAATGPGSLINGQFDSYFIIVDKLSETLKERMHTWKKQLKRLRGPCLFNRAKREAKRRNILVKQLQVALDIASAVEYLHNKGVMHRDIKVSNCGFDTHGTCKLFDLGLAEEIRFDQQGEPLAFNERVGSSKYMAPEVAMRQDYDTKADVYSFAVTLFQILSLSSSSSQDKRKKKYTEEGECIYEAPTACPSWPFAIQTMLARAFSSTSALRPTMSEIRDVLRREIERFEYKDLSMSLKDPNAAAARRRSSVSSYTADLMEFMIKHDVLLPPDEQEEEDATVCTLTTKDTLSTLTTRGTSSTSHYHDL